jgi:hypothetical protein
LMTCGLIPAVPEAAGILLKSKTAIDKKIN